MSERKRHSLLRRVLLALLGVFILLAAVFVAALHSETVFRFALDAARPFIPGSLRYQAIEGTLAGPVHATAVEYEINGTVVYADTLDFDLSPFALFAGRIGFETLHAKALRITLPPADEAAEDKPPMQPQDIFDALALPVHLRADALAIDGLVLQDADGPLMQLEHFEAAIDWNAQKLGITTLDASGPEISASGHATLGLARRHASDIDLDLDWQGNAVPVAARINGKGNAARLDLAVQLREPAQATLQATLRDLAGTPQWQGSLDVDAASPAAFGKNLPDTAWTGTFTFAGNSNDTRIQGAIEGGWPPAEGVDLVIDARVNEQRMHVDSLRGNVAAFGSAIDASGELHYAEALRYAMNGEITYFSWPGLEQFALHDVGFSVAGDREQLELELDAAGGEDVNGKFSVDGELAFSGLQIKAVIEAKDLALQFEETALKIAAFSATANGTPDDYSANVNASLAVNTLPMARVALHAKGNLDRVDAGIESLQWLSGNAQGRVTADWQEQFALDARLRGQGFDPGAIVARFRGRVGGDIRFTGRFGETPDMMLRLASLAGEIAGHEIDGSGTLQLSGRELATSGFKLNAGAVNLVLSDAASGFDFQVQVPALGVFHPGLGGEIHAKGHFNGALHSPSLRVDAGGSNVTWQEWEADAFELDANLVEAGHADSQLQFIASGLETPFTNADRTLLEWRGKLTAHSLRADVQGANAEGEAHLELHGGLDGDTWQGAIDVLRLAHPASGEWQLVEPDRELSLKLSKDAVEMPEHCLEGAAGRACLALHRDAQAWRANGMLESIPVGIIANWLPPGLEYDGTVSGEFSADTRQDMQGSASFRLTAGSIRQAADDATETLLGWTGGTANVCLQDRTADAALDIALLDGGVITGNGSLDMPENSQATVNAELRATIGSLQLVPSLVPALSELQGRATARLAINGPLDAPRVRGDVKLRDARARLLALGTDWENITLDIEAEGREIAMRGHAEAGEGYIDIELDARDAGERFTGKAKLTGENFKAVQTPEADINISPQLGVALDGRDLYVDGTVRVPFARIQPRDLSTAVQPSADQVIVSDDKRADDDGLRVHVAVATELGDDVRIDALGLKARMEGRLTVLQQPGDPPTGNGRLAIAEGEYTAYGQDLTLARGEIIYTGQPLANPGLDIRAERKPQSDITVGVAVRGPLAQPSTSVYSDPPMSQTEALSWLLFGRSIEQATGEEEGRINEAALALGLGGQRLLGNVGRKLGVEEIRVEDVSDRERASLVLGKYLSPDLYVSYGIGLFEAANSFRIRYRISSKWTLEATSGLKSSADFLYTIER